MSYKKIINYYQSQCQNEKNYDFLLENWEDYFNDKKPTKFDGN
jgi:hypothetical protein